jgi:stearoyl-CoA desaturase (delta-9 desaturase)
VRLDRSKTECDFDTLQAVLTHRYDVLAKYARYLTSNTLQEIERLASRSKVPEGMPAAAALARSLHREASDLDERERAAVGALLESSAALRTVYQMRSDLIDIWTRTNVTRDQLLGQLQDWCHRAEQSDIAGLKRFSRLLRSYA